MDKISQNKICPTCSKEFSKPKNRSIKSWSLAKFCSMKCRRLTEETKNVLRDINTGRLFRPYSSEERSCAVCGKLFRVWKAKIKAGKGVCCSRKCAAVRMKTTSYLVNRTEEQKSFEILKSAENRSGEKSHLWKGGITPEIRKIRNSKETALWRKACFERDNFTCQATGQLGGRLAVHHINNFADFPELRTSIENGITLSDKSHREFHKEYGRRNNTLEQLQEFLHAKGRFHL